MGQIREAFIGLDTAKETMAVAVAEGIRGEVRFYGNTESDTAAIRQLVRKFAAKYQRLVFCYEAGPTGYELYREIVALGHKCIVVAPSMTPRRPGDRIKTNRRDAVTLAKLLRADELTEVWVPDREHEAIRDLSRAREAAMTDLREKRQQVLSFLLQHGKVYNGRSHWSKAHRRWICDVTFEHPAQRIVLQELLYAIDDAAARLDRLVKHLAEIVPTWSLAPMATAFQAMRGVAFTTAVTFLAEVGELSRFATPQQLMGYLGLVPSEHSTGRRVRHGEITKTGNARARRVLIEGAWTYRYAAKVSAILHERSDGVTKAVRDIAWKAQTRLCARYRRFAAKGKKHTIITTAIAREMAAFLWAIAREVAPQRAAG